MGNVDNKEAAVDGTAESKPVVLFFIIGFIASLIVGWIIYPSLLYSKKEQPVNLLESYGAMMRWRRNGVPWSSDEFQTEYVQLVRNFLEQAQRRQWPPVIIDFGDEDMDG